MAKSKRAEPKGSEPLRRLFNLLKDDWTTLNGKYPDQALFALGDKRVVAALETRFDDKAGLKNITSLSYNRETGLNGIYFEFAADTKHAGMMLPDAFLVLMDGSCKVVAIVDPFDPEQPNAFAPASLRQADQPFVLSRPSVADQLVFSEAELLSVRMRSRQFFMELAGLEGDGGDVEIYTTSSYWTSTNLGRDGYNDRNLDDCGLPETILA